MVEYINTLIKYLDGECLDQLVSDHLHDQKYDLLQFLINSGKEKEVTIISAIFNLSINQIKLHWKKLNFTIINVPLLILDIEPDETLDLCQWFINNTNLMFTGTALASAIIRNRNVQLLNLIFSRCRFNSDKEWNFSGQSVQVKQWLVEKFPKLANTDFTKCVLKLNI